MKILHIVSSIDPKSGGPTRSIKGLCRSLARKGEEMTLFVLSTHHDMRDPGRVRFIKGRANGLRVAWQDVGRVLDEVNPDIVHLHGLWMVVNHLAVMVARQRGIPYMVAPRGMLEPWSLNAKKRKKRLALWLYQRSDLERAVALHATAESEAEQFRKLGFKQPIIISPNGVDLPENMPPRTTREDGKSTILFLSRIHPKKGLIELAEAWAEVRRISKVLKFESAKGKVPEGGLSGETLTKIEDQRPEGASLTTNALMNSRTDELPSWRIEYAGPDYGGYFGEVQKRIKELGVEEDFTYLGDLSDKEKWAAYRRADVFVLPTYSENFGIVVAEALAAGVPVITTKGTPWSELLGNSNHSSLVNYCFSALVEDVQNSGDERLETGMGTNELMKERTNELASSGRAGWWIDIGVEPLAGALIEAMTLSDEDRSAMGVNGRNLVEAKYTWPAIAEQMKSAYEWILNDCSITSISVMIS
jgi:glycosyltransferase involved in cell wall biosynthesis